MNHLDEGTIHAWLDGALDAEQSRDIEAHVAGCPSCSSAVAEARGLIAGASRILGALDDVPAGVIPRGASAPPRTAARLKARAQWHPARWLTGIAAVLVGAVVLSTTHRADRATQMSRPLADVVYDSAPTAAVRTDTAIGAPPQAERAAAPALVPQPASSRSTSVASAARNPATTKSAVATVAKQTRSPDAPSRTEDVRVEAPTERRITPSFGEVAGARPLVVDTVTMASGVTRARADTTRLRRLGDRSRALSEVVVTSAPVDALAEANVERFAGCYRVDAPIEAAQERAIAAGAVGVAERRRAAAPSPAPAAPSAASAADRDFSGRGIAPLIRLDTTRVDGQRRALRVASDSAVGSWRVVRDSIRVDLIGRGVVMLTPQRRIDCH